MWLGGSSFIRTGMTQTKSDLLTKEYAEIRQRIEELDPLVQEHATLTAAEKALKPILSNGHAGSSNGASAAKAIAVPRRGQRKRPGRRKGSGTRAAQALELVTAHPGIAIPGLAEKMGINQNYLYRVLPGLEAEGKVKRDGKGWVPVAVEAPIG